MIICHRAKSNTVLECLYSLNLGLSQTIVTFLCFTLVVCTADHSIKFFLIPSYKKKGKVFFLTLTTYQNRVFVFCNHSNCFSCSPF